ncbi:MAG: recombination protein RecR [Patescibacteria group bacterium]|jgi:recombination protein RecR|nr:recombination protein RecR [Patescibacteria group bacterium]
MRKFPAPIHNAVAALGKLPGVGPKTALRYAFALLRLQRGELELVAKSIDGLKFVTTCDRCFTYAEASICEICRDSKRDSKLLCIVAEARDIATIEATGIYHGLYLVLGGVLNPVDGYTPDKLNVKELQDRLQLDRDIGEVILAFSPDVHGETTILYLSRMLKNLGKKTTRLARGLPMGADIEYADEVTLASALSGRSET